MEQADGYLLAGMVASCRSPKQDPNSKTIIYIYIIIDTLSLPTVLFGSVTEFGLGTFNSTAPKPRDYAPYTRRLHARLVLFWTLSLVYISLNSQKRI